MAKPVLMCRREGGYWEQYKDGVKAQIIIFADGAVYDTISYTYKQGMRERFSVFRILWILITLKILQIGGFKE